MSCTTKTRVERDGELAVIRFEGDIMSISGDAVLGEYQGLAPGATKILLDFSRVSYLNSSGIALVIQLLIAAGKASQRVICFGLSAHFVKVFTLLGLTKYTSLYPDEVAARAAVS